MLDYIFAMKKISAVTFLCFALTVLIVSADQVREFTLEEVIAIGLEHNPYLSAQDQNAAAGEAGFRAARLWHNPSLAYQRGQARSWDRSVERQTEGFSLTQPIENPIKRHFRIQIAEQNWHAAENARDAARLDAVFEIKRSFFKILLLQKKEEYTRKKEASILEIHKLMDTRARLGEVKELEVIKLFVESLKAGKERKQVHAEWEISREELNTILGNLLPSDFILEGKLDFAPVIYDEKERIATALSSHPYLREKRLAVDSAQSAVNYTKWQVFPDFELTGFSEKHLDGKGSGIGVSLNIPLWNLGAHETEKAHYLLLQQSRMLNALELEVSAQVKAAIRRLRISEEALNIFYQGLLDQAEKSLRISELSYKQGEISLIDFLDAQRTYFSILEDFQDALYTWNTDKAALEKAVGEQQP